MTFPFVVVRVFANAWCASRRMSRAPGVSLVVARRRRYSGHGRSAPPQPMAAGCGWRLARSWTASTAGRWLSARAPGGGLAHFCSGGLAHWPGSSRQGVRVVGAARGAYDALVHPECARWPAPLAQYQDSERLQRRHMVEGLASSIDARVPGGCVAPRWAETAPRA